VASGSGGVVPDCGDVVDDWRDDGKKRAAVVKKSVGVVSECRDVVPEQGDVVSD